MSKTRGTRSLRAWWRNDISSIINSGGFPLYPMTNGKAFFVNPDHARASDSNNPGTNPDRPLNTVPAAYDLMTSGNDDIAYLSSNSTHDLSSMLTVSKSRCHFIGTGPLRQYGQGCKVSLGVTTAATDIATMKNTGVRNSFTNIKWINENTVAEGIYCVVEAGEYAKYDYNEIYKSTDLNVTGAAELVSNGDSSRFLNCTIGSNANAISGAIIRPNVLVTNGIIAGKVSRDVEFVDCYFWRRSSNTANRFVYGANAADVQRMMLFDNCKFWNAKLSAAVPAQNVAFGASLTVGYVLLNNCVSIGAATAMSTTTGVFVNGPNQTSTAGGAEIGIALQAA